MTVAEIYLEARNPATGCARAYRVTLTRDLFGAFLVESRYGKIGTYGRAITHSFADEQVARAFIETCLRRRRTSPTRIGVPYMTMDRRNI